MTFECEHAEHKSGDLYRCNSKEYCDFKIPFNVRTSYCKILLHQSMARGDLEKKLAAPNRKGKENG